VASDVLAFARELFPEQSIQVASLVLVGLWGYPEFPGLSQSDPVNIFLFPTKENGYDWIACARMDDGGAIRSSLSLQNLSTKEVGDWTVIGSREEPLATAVKNGPGGALLALAARPLQNDFRLDVHPDLVERFLVTHGKALWGNFVEKGERSGHLPSLPRPNLLENFAQQIEGLSAVGDFRGKTFLGSLRLSAREGSDLAHVLCAPEKQIGPLHIAKALPASGQFQLLFRCDPEKLCQTLKLCLNHCIGGDLCGVSEQEICNFLEEVFSRFAGTVASRSSADGTVRRLIAIDVGRKRLGDWAEFVCERLIPALTAQAGPLPLGMDFQLSATADREAFHHRGIPAVSITVQAEGFFSAPGEEGPEQIPFSSRDQFFFCSLGNAIAMANDEKALRETVDDFLNGGPTGPSFAEAMPFGPDAVARAHVDLLELFGLEGQGKGIDLIVRFREGSAVIDFSLDGGDLGVVLRATGDPCE
jgi:hypothetical protein